MHPVQICNIPMTIHCPKVTTVSDPSRHVYRGPEVKSYWPLTKEMIPSLVISGAGPVEHLAPMVPIGVGEFLVDHRTAWVLAGFNMGANTLVERPLIERDGRPIPGRWWYLHIGEAWNTVVPTREAEFYLINSDYGIVSGPMRAEPGQVPVDAAAGVGADIWCDPLLCTGPKDGIFMSARLAKALEDARVNERWQPVPCRDATEEDRNSLDFDPATYFSAPSPRHIKRVKAAPFSASERQTSLARLRAEPMPEESKAKDIDLCIAWLASEDPNSVGPVPLPAWTLCDNEHSTHAFDSVFHYLQEKGFSDERFHEDALLFRAFLNLLISFETGELLPDTEIARCVELLRRTGQSCAAAHLEAAQRDRNVEDGVQVFFETLFEIHKTLCGTVDEEAIYPPLYWEDLTSWIDRSPAFVAVKAADWPRVREHVKGL